MVMCADIDKNVSIFSLKKILRARALKIWRTMVRIWAIEKKGGPSMALKIFAYFYLLANNGPV